MVCKTRVSAVITVILASRGPTRAVRLDVADGVAALAGELHTVKKGAPRVGENGGR